MNTRIKLHTCIHLFLILLLTSSSIIARAQEAEQGQGMHFVDQSLSWAEVLAKAKAEHKYIFVDVTQRENCSGCLFFMKKVAPQRQCGNFCNDKYICVEVDLDYFNDPPEYIDTCPLFKSVAKSWRKDAEDIFEKYHIRGTPTWLIFAPDGHIIDRLGRVYDPYKDEDDTARAGKKFVSYLRRHLNPAHQYYTQMQKIKEGKKPDKATLKELYEISDETLDEANKEILAKELRPPIGS